MKSNLFTVIFLILIILLPLKHAQGEVVRYSYVSENLEIKNINYFSSLNDRRSNKKKIIDDWIQSNTQKEETITYFFHLESAVKHDLMLFFPIYTGKAAIYINDKKAEELSVGHNFSFSIPTLIALEDLAINDNIISIKLFGNSDYKNGISQALVVGEPKEIKNYYYRYLVKYTTFFAISLFIALFIGIIFINRRTEHFYLYFALLSVFVGTWIAGIKGLPLYIYNHRYVFYFTTYAAAILNLMSEIMFIVSFFRLKKGIAVKVVLGFYSFLLLFLLGEITITGHIYYYQKYLYQPFMMSLSVVEFVLVGVVFRLMLKKVQYASRILLGLLCIAVPISMLFLYYIPKPLISFEPPLLEGFFAMIIVFATILASRYGHAFSSLEKAYDELKVIDKVKDDFLATTSHELKTPLTGIIGITDSLLGDEESLRNDHPLKLIKKSALHLSSLVSDILDFSKLNAGKVDLFLSTFDLVKTVQTVCSLLSFQAAAKELNIIYDHPDEELLIEADQRRVRQILINLIGNSIKFTSQGDITVNTEIRDMECYIVVADKGRGIARDQQKRIFLPFEQTEDVLTRDNGGTGLGLAVVSRLVELHSGSIQLSSEPEQGSTFTIRLPVKQTKRVGIKIHSKAQEDSTDQSLSQHLLEAVEACKETDEAKGLQIKHRATILVVDDDPINVWSIESICSRFGHRVLKAYTGSEALEIVKKENVELILLDLMLPGMSGYEVCRKLREEYRDHYLPVIIMTAYGDESNGIVRGFEVGANDYVAKPFDGDVLIMRVENQLAIRNMLEIERSIVKNNELSTDNVENLVARSTTLKEQALQLSRWESIIQEDMGIASGFQKKLMTQSLINGIEYSLFYEPLFQIGGDIYDVCEISKGIVRIFLADATGHGINASLNTVKILSEYSAVKTTLGGPKEIISYLNNRFHNSFGDYQIFFTCISVELNLNTNTIRLSMAGHLDQLIRTEDNELTPLKLKGPIIGLWDNPNYEEKSAPFPANSLLVLFSDGIFELLENDKNREHPFPEQTAQIIQELNQKRPLKPSMTAQMISDHILGGENRGGTREHSDDMTLLVIKRL